MKKPTSIVAFLITFLLGASVVCTQGYQDEYVVDTDGNPLEYDTQYYIQPIKTKNNNGGGLIPASTSVLHVCPLGITQTVLPLQPSLPVIFKTPYPLEETNIKTKTATAIEFQALVWPLCSGYSKLWKYDDSSSAGREPAILVGGKLHAENSWFGFERVTQGTEESIYKITTSSGSVGTKSGGLFGPPELVLTNDASKTLLVQFKKVFGVTTETTSTSTSTSRVEKFGLRMFPF